MILGDDDFVIPKIARFGNLKFIHEDLHQISVECFTRDEDKLKLLKDANVIFTTLANTMQLER